MDDQLKIKILSEEEKIHLNGLVDQLLVDINTVNPPVNQAVILFSMVKDYADKKHKGTGDYILELFLDRAEKMQLFEICAALRDTHKKEE